MIFSLLACACRKESKNTIIFGKVTPSRSSKPLEGVSILQDVNGHFVGSVYEFDHVVLCVCDKEGNFEYCTQSAVDMYYSDCCFYTSHPSYGSKGYHFEIGAMNSFSVQLDPAWYLNVHIKNVNPFDDNDQFYLNVGYQSSFLKGSDIDTTFTLKLEPLNNATIICQYTKNNITTTLPDETIPVSDFDTVHRSYFY